jgi:hypothetical protein
MTEFTVHHWDLILIWLKKEDDDLCRLHQRSTVAT